MKEIRDCCQSDDEQLAIIDNKRLLQSQHITQVGGKSIAVDDEDTTWKTNAHIGTPVDRLVDGLMD